MISRLVLLPGMDGSGELFERLVEALPEEFSAEVVRFPRDVCLSYSELMSFVCSAGSISESSVLVAESFSTPLAIQFAATHPPRLKGLILCAGFATSPISGWLKSIASLIAPLAFRLPLPKVAVSYFLVGPNAPESIHIAVRAVIRSVEPKVLAARLRQVLAIDVRLALEMVSVPILYVQAKRDRLVGPSCLEEIRRIKPQTEIAKIEGPHLIIQREPQQFADIVAKFIIGLQQG